MRYSPSALALAMLGLLSASSGHSQVLQAMDPRAASLEAIGRGALAAGDVAQATDAFEAALAVMPGSPRLVLDLADAARADGMQGKALQYYRAVLERDPQNVDAIAGEGAALAEKGAIEKARRNLARLEGLCGVGCPQAARLSEAIAKGPVPRIADAQSTAPKGAMAN